VARRFDILHEIERLDPEREHGEAIARSIRAFAAGSQAIAPPREE